MTTVLLFFLLAQSQPPAPSASPASRNQQKTGGAPQNNPAPKQDVSPSPQPTPPPNYLVVNQTYSNQDGGSSDKSAVFTIIATVITAVVGLLQLFVMRRQADISEQQTKIAEKQNVSIAAQTTHMEGQLKAAQDAVRHARDEMIYTLRARVGFFSVVIANFGPDRESFVTVRVKNFGGKTGIVDKFCIEMTTDPLPAKPEYEHWKELHAPIETGADIPVNVVITPPISKPMWEAITNEAGSVRLKIYGRFECQDGFGKSRATGFAVLYEPRGSRLSGSQQFSVTGGSSYNYPG